MQTKKKIKNMKQITFFPYKFTKHFFAVGKYAQNFVFPNAYVGFEFLPFHINGFEAHKGFHD